MSPKSNLLESLPRDNRSRLEKHLASLNLDGIESLDEHHMSNSNDSVRDLVTEYRHLFAMNPSKLGKTSLSSA